VYVGLMASRRHPFAPTSNVYASAQGDSTGSQ